ncbi:MAG: hypothetical protein AAGE84_17770 [Cyanobacteria bacterium P01_G01_bin.39]
MTNPIIETDLAQILNKLDGRFDKLDKRLEKIDDRLNKLEVGQAQLTVKVDNIHQTSHELKETQKKQVLDVADLKGVKSLIIPIVVAVTTSILTLIIRSIPIN